MDPANESPREIELREGSLVSGYVIGKKLGEGEMGEVYRATAPGGEEVALKILRVAAAGSAVELEKRFQREATLCASLRHRNVVSVSDHGIHGGLPFFVMPLLRGRDLEVCLARTGALHPEVAVAIVLQACAGVRAAHEAGVIHRDLKPANVFLDEESDGRINAIVCDFGVAKVRDDDGSLTASGAVLGTPLYMAPEQLLSSRRVDARCDVWALGMVLYHALTGQPAFQNAKTLGDLILLLHEGRIPPLQERAPWVAPALARIVHAALLPLDKRIASVRELENAILRWSPGTSHLSREHLVPMPDDRKNQVATRANLPADAAEISGQGEETLIGDMPADSAEPDAYIGRTVADRYRVVAKIGSGGMGAVYEAIDTSAAGDSRVVALKVVHHETGTRGLETIRRFLREAKASARIESPHVTRFLDSGVDAATGSPFIVMERLRGRDLSTHLMGNGALDVGPAVSLFLQACGALGAAHALGIVHRDIKPSNLFLHEEGDKIVLKVCDFGIAKQLAREGANEASTELTRSGGLVGSPLYMSPEQAKSSKNVDERTDIFSLALTLHEALSGERPWRGRTSMGEIIVAVCTEDVPPLDEVAPWIDGQLSAIVAKALSRDPMRRFAGMGELAAALAPFASKQEVGPADLVGVPSAARSRARPPTELESARTQTAAALIAKAKATADPVSVTANDADSRRPPARSRKTAAIVALCVAAVGAGGAFALSRAKGSEGSDLGKGVSSFSSLPAPREAVSLPGSAAPVSSGTAAPAAPVAPVAPASVSAAVSAAPSASAAAAAAAAAPRHPRPDPAVTAARTAPTPPLATTPAPPTMPSVGRGVTATDLPSH